MRTDQLISPTGDGLWATIGASVQRLVVKLLAHETQTWTTLPRIDGPEVQWHRPDLDPKVLEHRFDAIVAKNVRDGVTSAS